MKSAIVSMHGRKAGSLIEIEKGRQYRFEYDDQYCGEPVALTLPLSQKKYEFTSFPAFFEGLLPEGVQLEALLRIRKIDRSDFFSQLLAVGQEMVGAVTVEEGQ